MRRREFISMLGGAAVVPLIPWSPAARTEQSERVRRIGVWIFSGNDPETQHRIGSFLQGLRERGWTDGGNIRIDYRSRVADSERLKSQAAELVALKPDVILATNSTTAEALRRETRTVPIVFVGASDPLSSGLVESMARPGGNLTGFTNFEFPMGGKWLATLKEVAPGTERVLVLRVDNNIGSQGFLRAIEAPAAALGVRLLTVDAGGAVEIERTIQAFAQEPNGGLLVLPGAGLEHRDLIVALAARHRLPAMYTLRPFIASGGLMSHDTDIADLYRRAASYVDRILRGEKPGDLPVQAPTRFELVINMKVARALGLTVPLPLLALADEVIE